MTNGAVYCNRCGTQNSALAKFCANCGSPFTSDAVHETTTPSEVIPRPQGPAAPPPSNVSAPAYASPQMYATPALRYGGFWIRFVAVVIDAIIVNVVVWPVAGMLGLAIGLAGGAISMPTIGVHLVNIIVVWTLSTLASWLYEAMMESSSKQATLGKMALGLKVTDLEGRRISFARASGRHFSKIISGAILAIGFIMAGLTERKQALHDMIAGTLVRRTL
ncbi:MAG TPA: RDD family protein [Terriglobales bacterium]|nr:RDD family protein [Terriglobales bacterium]